MHSTPGACSWEAAVTLSLVTHFIWLELSPFYASLWACLRHADEQPGPCFPAHVRALLCWDGHHALGLYDSAGVIYRPDGWAAVGFSKLSHLKLRDCPFPSSSVANKREEMAALAALMCMLPWPAAHVPLLIQGLRIIKHFCKRTLWPRVHVKRISRPDLSTVPAAFTVLLCPSSAWG